MSLFCIYGKIRTSVFGSSLDFPVVPCYNDKRIHWEVFPLTNGGVMLQIPKIGVGDVLEMKKAHPCGAKRFLVMRTGSDIRLVCEGCKTERNNKNNSCWYDGQLDFASKLGK